MKQIKINGLLWDAENLEIDGKTYFTFNEARNAAETVGKRLPTAQEFEKLASLWTRWDDERKGRLFRDNEGNELFLPATGNRACASETLAGVGRSGNYWSETFPTITEARGLNFDYEIVFSLYTSDMAYGFAVRCVQYIE